MIASGRKLGFVALSVAALSCGFVLPSQSHADDMSVSAASMRLFDAAKAARIGEIAVQRQIPALAAESAADARDALSQIKVIRSALRTRHDASQVALAESERRLAAAEDAQRQIYVAWVDQLRKEEYRRLVASGCTDLDETASATRSPIIAVSAGSDCDRATRVSARPGQRVAEPPALVDARNVVHQAQHQTMADRAALITAQTKLRYIKRIEAEVRATLDAAGLATAAAAAPVGPTWDDEVFDALQDTGFDQDALGSQVN